MPFLEYPYLLELVIHHLGRLNDTGRSATDDSLEVGFEDVCFERARAGLTVGNVVFTVAPPLVAGDKSPHHHLTKISTEFKPRVLKTRRVLRRQQLSYLASHRVINEDKPRES